VWIFHGRSENNSKYGNWSSENKGYLGKEWIHENGEENRKHIP